MEKIKKPVYKVFPFVKLYREDIDEIIGILTEAGFEHIEIQTGDYKLDSSEIDKLKEKELSEIKISGYGSFDIYLFLSPTLMRRGPLIRISEDSIMAAGIIEKIGQLFKKRRRFLFSITTNVWFPFSILIFGLIIATVLIKIYNYPQFIVISFITVLLLFYVLFYASISFLDSRSIFPKNQIILEYKKNRPNFFDRNKDKLLISLITAILVALATFLLRKI